MENTPLFVETLSAHQISFLFLFLSIYPFGYTQSELYQGVLMLQ